VEGGEAVAEGALFAATQGGMLEDVWHPRGVGRVGLEADGEDIVGVVPGNVNVFGARLVVLQLEGRQLQLGHLLYAAEGEAMELLAHSGEGRGVGDGGIGTTEDGRRGRPREAEGRLAVLQRPAGGAQHGQDTHGGDGMEWGGMGRNGEGVVRW